LEFIFKKNLQDKFREKANEIRNQADGIGWEFTDGMNEIYYEYYGEEEE
jgi:hypothetical protein